MIVLVTFLAVGIVVFRTSKRTLRVSCEESLKEIVVKVLDEQGVKYEFSDPEGAALIIEKRKITYRNVVYNLVWSKKLNKRIEELLSNYFEGATVEALPFDFLSRRYKLIVGSSVLIVDVRAMGKDILPTVIKSILNERGDYFENGFLFVPIEALLNGKRIFFYDPRVDQVFFEDAGGS